LIFFNDGDNVTQNDHDSRLKGRYAWINFLKVNVP
jgi:hypothetical protein